MKPDGQHVQNPPPKNGVTVARATLDDATHASAIVELIREYAREPVGGAADLPEAVRGELVAGLRRHPTAVVFLAWSGAEAIGVAVCFVGFSTFAARPLINVHDLAVSSGWRRRGVGRRLLEAVEQHARAIGACKVTLEVRDDNQPAKALYRDLGFLPGAGPDLFWQKPLGAT